MNLCRPHPSHITWVIDQKELLSPEFSVSPLTKETKRTEEILKKLGYSLSVEPLTDEILDAFFILYTNFLSEKPRGNVFPIKDRVKENRAKGIEYTFFGLYSPAQELIGGMIVSFDHEHSLATTNYKTLPHTLPERKHFPANIAYVFTYKFYEFALSHGAQTISHGRDRNPYGVYSNIGLGLFKIRAGVKPKIPKNITNVTFNQTISYTSEEDMFVWLGETAGAPIKEAILITHLTETEAKEKYKPLWSLADLTIEIWDYQTYRNTLQDGS